MYLLWLVRLVLTAMKGGKSFRRAHSCRTPKVFPPMHCRQGRVTSQNGMSPCGRTCSAERVQHGFQRLSTNTATILLSSTTSLPTSKHSTPTLHLSSNIRNQSILEHCRKKKYTPMQPPKTPRCTGYLTMTKEKHPRVSRPRYATRQNKTPHF